jgi:hypothetical protein
MQRVIYILPQLNHQIKRGNNIYIIYINKKITKVISQDNVILYSDKSLFL